MLEMKAINTSDGCKEEERKKKCKMHEYQKRKG